ncbi:MULTISPECIES: DUF4845 domain-containing protein [Legionella]|uniref:DUF4845 domain-containing protein n=1 Tax=Legionella septentrionalis TaxID=2498109 RepID=A0A3S0X119_9GAMM|nr:MULTISPECIES: DUF4845 domain-containing protein [Legionella]MCP0914186.1 DUF4845 domain-containing protein [Legionella sp. 27cVA30]RUQ89238.1 DUF4845 domain-containing protein [Legionella septentrionalis]RUR00527.1 DUF4845 domain-containing protein [Legionella septentrionalis]RUR11728.1 DUF4845 domain-containing protein [Legionella septentrionalis]RUR17416.1 DUF4845 domain-containing protein [Legionella septentrionalis]
MHTQKGMTVIGMLLTAAVIVILGILVMRVIPVYIENYTITRSIDALKKIPAEDFSADPSANAQLLKSKLMNQLYVNGVEIPENQIQVIPGNGGNFTVKIKYQVIKPVVSNASLLFNFDVSKEVNIGK